MDLFGLNFLLRLSMPLRPRIVNILRQLVHDLLKGIDMLLLLFYREIGLIQRLSKLEHLIKKFLPFRRQGSNAFFHVMVLFHGGVGLDDSIIYVK